METKSRGGTFALSRFLVDIKRIERRMTTYKAFEKDPIFDSSKKTESRQTKKQYYEATISPPDNSWNSEETATRFIKRSALPRPPEPKSNARESSHSLPAPISPRRKSVSFLLDDDSPNPPISATSK